MDAKRVHTLFHPACFPNLITSLGFAPPDKKLKVPQFLLPDDKGGRDVHPGERPYRKDPEPEELTRVADLLREEGGRRCVVDSSLLSIVVDGLERTTLEPHAGSHAEVEIDESAELLEVRRREDNLLPATCLLPYDDLDDEEVHTSSTVVGGGQEIRFEISVRPGPREGETVRVVNVAYRRGRRQRAGL